VTGTPGRRARNERVDATVPPSPGWRARLTRFVRDWALVVGVAAVGLLGFAKVGEDVFAHESTSFDGAVQAWILAHQSPLADRIFTWITIVGGINAMRVLALATAAFLWYRGRRDVAAGVLIAPVFAVVLFNVIKALYARPRPLGLGGRVDSSYSFPSGHATTSAAVCGTLAYVLWREGFLRGRLALAFAIVAPLLIGGSRLYLNVHWATDVLGGWCAGLLVAVLSAALYDRYRRRRPADRARSSSPTPTSDQPPPP
jgi:undecaprenyl-diphosphatase